MAIFGLMEIIRVPSNTLLMKKIKRQRKYGNTAMRPIFILLPKEMHSALIMAILLFAGENAKVLLSAKCILTEAPFLKSRCKARKEIRHIVFEPSNTDR